MMQPAMADVHIRVLMQPDNYDRGVNRRSYQGYDVTNCDRCVLGWVGNIKAMM